MFAALIGLGAYPDAVAIAGDTFAAEQIGLQYVSGNFFTGLQVPLAIGRPFEFDDDRVGAEPLVIISHRFWVNRFGRNLDVLDRRVRINNVPARVIGVAPAGFFGLRVGAWPDAYAPLAAKIAFQPPPSRAGAPVAEDDSNWWVRMIGRLEPGVDAATARVRLNGAFRALVAQEATSTAPATATAAAAAPAPAPPATAPAPTAAAAAPATRATAPTSSHSSAAAAAAPPAGATSALEARVVPDLVTLPGERGFDALGPRDAQALRILVPLVAVLFVLVCANVANLLLSRSVGRQRESALRLTLGATRRRLFRQHLIESGVLALLGGAAGLALGYVLAHGHPHRLSVWP